MRFRGWFENLMLEDPVGIYDDPPPSKELAFLQGIVDFSFENIAEHNPVKRKALYDANKGDGIAFPNTELCLRNCKIEPTGETTPAMTFPNDWKQYIFVTRDNVLTWVGHKVRDNQVDRSKLVGYIDNGEALVAPWLMS